MKFSLIIPVYNTAEYLADCLNSCMNQHNMALGRDYEIICVNDGRLMILPAFWPDSRGGDLRCPPAECGRKCSPE